MRRTPREWLEYAREVNRSRYKPEDLDECGVPLKDDEGGHVSMSTISHGLVCEAVRLESRREILREISFRLDKAPGHAGFWDARVIVARMIAEEGRDGENNED